MVANLHDFGKILFLIRRRKYVIFLTRHKFMRQLRLKNTARRSARNISANHRIKIKHGKGFLRQQNMTAGFVLHRLQNFQIFPQFAFIYNVARCIHIFKISNLFISSLPLKI